MTLEPLALSDAILDAAREVFEEYGARRANVDDVAQAAGISRSTLYRRLPQQGGAAAGGHRSARPRSSSTSSTGWPRDLPPQEAVIECFAQGIAIMREIPVLGRLAKTEPEMITGMPGSESLRRRPLPPRRATLRRSGARMPDDELHLVAELLLRLASTFLLDPGGTLDLTDPPAVRDYAKRFLSPLVD